MNGPLRVNIMLETRQIFVIFFVAFISLFAVIVSLVRFNTNNKYLFLTYMLTRLSNN